MSIIPSKLQACLCPNIGVVICRERADHRKHGRHYKERHKHAQCHALARVRLLVVVGVGVRAAPAATPAATKPESCNVLIYWYGTFTK